MSTLPPVTSTVTSTLPVTSTTGSNTNSTTASTTTTPVVQNPVATADRKLFKTAVDNLWEEKVTQASNIFTKFAGLFSYLWNKSTAVASDKQHGTTIVDLNNKAVALVNAVAKRALTPTEAQANGVNTLQHVDPKKQEQELADKNAAIKAEKEFYDVFKLRCTQLNVDMNSTDFGVYANAAMSHVTTISNSNKSPNVSTKMETMQGGFNKRIYADMVEAYANQPIANITVDSYKQKVATIKGFFGDNSVVDIEASLRQALKGKFDQEFNTVSGQYLDASLTNPKVAELKTQLSEKFVAERNAINEELAALRGPSGWNGSIHAAQVKLDQAQLALDAAKLAFVQAFNGAFPGVNVSTPAEQLAALDFGTLPTALQSAKTDLLARIVDFTAARNEHAALVAKLNELAVYDHTGAVRGGKLHEVNQKLVDATLTGEARTEATKIGNFYRELHTPVTTANKQARFNRMHAVIGN